MTAARRTTFALSLILAASACLNPKLTRWYDSAEWLPASAAEPPAPSTRGVTITAFPVATAPRATAARGLFDLEQHGQAAFVEQVGKRLGQDATPAELARALATPIRSAPRAATVDNRHRLTTRLVVSLDSRPGPPADRFTRVDLILEPETRAQFRFVSWDKIETQHATVDLGKVAGSQENTFDLGVDLGLPKAAEIEGAGASAKLARALTEEVELRRRYRVYSGSLLPERARLVRDGALGIDLTGNTIFTLTVEPMETDSVRAFSVSGYKAKGEWQPGAKLKLDSQRVVFPKNADPMKVRVRAEYVLRTVGKGARTQLEGDDEVVFRREYVAAEATLVDSPVLRQVFWVLESEGEPIVLEGSTPDVADTLVFDTAAEANAFRAWALANPEEKSIAGRRLALPGPAPRRPVDLGKPLVLGEYKRNFTL